MLEHQAEGAAANPREGRALTCLTRPVSYPNLLERLYSTELALATEILEEVWIAGVSYLRQDISIFVFCLPMVNICKSYT